MEKVNVNWSGDMAFEAEVNGFKIPLDAEEKVGGKNTGPRPKPLVLVALAGCTGMDVVSILGKMKVEFDYFNVEVRGKMTEEHPRYYDKIHIKYFFRGNQLPIDKIEKAILLSQEKYCGVSVMLRKVAEITHEIVIE
jgi:putative redox protein